MRAHALRRYRPEADGIHLSRRTLLGVGVTVLTALAWAGATTWYIAARDDLAQRVFIRETEMKYAYENRIAQLSARLEREITQNLVERRTVDVRIAAVAARQAEIEARQAWLRAAAEQAGLPGGASAVTVRAGVPGTRVASKQAAPSGDEKPGPLPDVTLRLRDGGSEGDPAAPRPRDRLSLLEKRLDGAAAHEIEIVKAIGGAARERLSQLRSALDATGIDLTAREANDRGVGGPFVPVDLKPGSGPTGFLFADLGSSLAELKRLDILSRALPLGRPVDGQAEQTSGFGTRLDPFTRGPAMHTGVDFRAEAGTPARATGAGRVVTAEYAGGYGNMVEIDHGNGVATRYGHLTSFAVAPGERVEAGQTVGLTGSTGRSTGPHLHYETRIAGEPVNPVRFLEAGKLLGLVDG